VIFFITVCCVVIYRELPRRGSAVAKLQLKVKIPSSLTLSDIVNIARFQNGFRVKQAFSFWPMVETPPW
jgi:hypothetical protein